MKKKEITLFLIIYFGYGLDSPILNKNSVCIISKSLLNLNRTGSPLVEWRAGVCC